jgi:hypothetical protein
MQAHSCCGERSLRLSETRKDGRPSPGKKRPMMIPACGRSTRELEHRLRLLRVSLLGLAAMSAALLAHVVIDIVGDYVLARDAYDGLAHASRGIFVVGLTTLALAVSSYLLFDLLDRRCSSKASMLRLTRDSLGRPIVFAMQSMAICVLALGGMEFFDCLAAHAPPAGLDELFGGSYLLGLTTACTAAALTGWLLHRLLFLVSEREPEIIALIRCVMASFTVSEEPHVAKPTHASRSIARALLLATRGSKRGPPLPIPT